ncbi:hypothetical protein ACO229_01610 [Promicromonospora sp. MS192]|uniref:hypothetical protein n=1 Tax=Promicromonospora sp. MS192 TaxID=3412684 RepID=UPI003C2D16E0
MSNTDGGWNPQDPYSQDPYSRDRYSRDPYGQQPRQPEPFDPYGPRDPYGRPANPYGRPDYQPRQPPAQPGQQAWPPEQPPAQQPGQQPGRAPGQQGLPQYSAVPDPEPAHGLVEEPPTVGRAWRWAWSAFGASWGTWVLMSVLLGVAQGAVVLVFSPSALDGILNATDPAAVDAAQAAGRTITAKGLAAAGTAVCFLLQALLYAGALAATRNRRVRFRDFFLLRGFGGLLGYAVITGALGFVSTAVPMVGWLVQVVFTLLLLPVPFLLLKGAGFGRALGGGIGLVLAHLPATLGVYAIFAGLGVASVVTCGLGLVVVAPAMLLVGAYLVQRWTGEGVHP